MKKTFTKPSNLSGPVKLTQEPATTVTITLEEFRELESNKLQIANSASAAFIQLRAMRKKLWRK